MPAQRHGCLPAHPAGRQGEAGAPQVVSQLGTAGGFGAVCSLVAAAARDPGRWALLVTSALCSSGEHKHLGSCWPASSGPMVIYICQQVVDMALDLGCRKSLEYRHATIICCAYQAFKVSIFAGPMLDALAEPLIDMAHGNAPEAQERNPPDAEDAPVLQLRACLGVVALSTAVLKRGSRLRQTSTANVRQKLAGSSHQQVAVAEGPDARSSVQLPASLQSALPGIVARLCLAVAAAEEPWPSDGSEEQPEQADSHPSQQSQQAAMLALLAADGSLAGDVLCCLAEVRAACAVMLWLFSAHQHVSILLMVASLHKCVAWIVVC